jgi:ferredoxin
MQDGDKMRVSIDREGCISCGNCEAICPEVFKLLRETDGKSSIVEKYRKGDLGKGEFGDDLKTCAENGRDGCPVQVIRTE